MKNDMNSTSEQELNKENPSNEPVRKSSEETIQDKINSIIDDASKENTQNASPENNDQNKNETNSFNGEAGKGKKGRVDWFSVIITVLAGVAIGLGAIFVDQKYFADKPEEPAETPPLIVMETPVVPEQQPDAQYDISDDVYQENGGNETSVLISDQVETEPEEPKNIYTVLTPLVKTYFDYFDQSMIAEELSAGTQIEVIGQDGEFLEYYLTNDVGTAFVSEYDVAPGIFYVTYPNAVDLRQVLPDSDFELLFASNRNVTHHSLYPAIPLLEAATADMLLEAEKIFEQDGYRIKIYDAYRPKRAQFELYDVVNDNRYIANPYNGNSWHNLGRAVDMSLTRIDTGEELRMPTPMHTFNSSASRYSSASWAEEVRENVDYMTSVMESVGFNTISTEWWHFENKNAGNSLPNELDYSQIVMVNAESF